MNVLKRSILTKSIIFLVSIFISVIGYKTVIYCLNKYKKESIVQDIEIMLSITQNLQHNHEKFVNDNNTSINISTALNKGLYYPIGSNICRFINHNKSKLHIDCRTSFSSGSFHNLRLLLSGETNFAIVQSDLTKDAIIGSGLFTKYNNKLKLITALHEEPLAIVVPAKSNIKSLDDLAGKIINFGENVNTNLKNLTDLIFKVKGWSDTIFDHITNFNLDEQPEALCNQHTDVMLLIAGTPNNIIQKVAEHCEIRIIEIKDPVILKAIEDNSKNNGIFVKTIIPGGVYMGVPKNIETIGVRAVLLTTDTTSRDLVYNITKTIIENSTYLKVIIQALANTKIVSNTLLMQNIIPLHEGSMKFFNEEIKSVDF